MRLATIVLLALALTAPAAHGLPGDEPFEPLTPPDNATLTVDPDGIPVTYTCPVYRVSSAGDGFTVYGGASDYGVSFATGPELGGDGRLRSDQTVALDNGHRSSAVPEGQCVSAMNPGGNPSQRVHEIPGTYFWQVWRLCTGCPAGYESGPVRKLVLRSAARPELRLPARAFAGFPAILTIGDVPTGATVTVQRRVGGAWRKLGSDTAVGEAAEVVAALPKGSQRLRAVVALGDQQEASPERTLTVRAAKGWTTRRSDDGRYKGSFGVSFTVARAGRELRNVRADVAMLCPGVLAGQTTRQIGTVAITRIRVAPDGSFYGAFTAKGQAGALRGRLSRREIKGGRAELSVGTCTGSQRFGARRT